jgi:integrase
MTENSSPDEQTGAGKPRSRRRGRDEGSVYQRESDGRWVGSVHIGYRDGKRIRKTVYGRTRSEAAAKLRAAQAAVAQGTLVHDERRTVEDYLTWWIDTVVPGTVKPTTEDGYRQILRLYVTPAVGKVKLAKLSPLHVQEMLSGMERRGLSAATRRQTRAILRRALGHAERFELVHRNAAAQTEAPRGVAHRIDDALTRDEARSLLDAAKGDPFESLVIVALSLGLRRGEVLALRWENVDLDAGTLTVAATLTRRRGHGLVESSPKTARSRRTLPLPQTCIRALREQKRTQAAAQLAAGPDWQGEGHVFTTPIGTPIDPRNLTTEFHRICTKAGLGQRRFHALRHSAATLMLAQGVPLAVISDVLGHASYAITADVYARVGEELKSEAAAAMDLALGQ